jgi:hypothetical protein
MFFSRIYAEDALRELLYVGPSKSLTMDLLVAIYGVLQQDGRKAFVTHLKLLKR